MTGDHGRPGQPGFDGTKGMRGDVGHPGEPGLAGDPVSRSRVIIIPKFRIIVMMIVMMMENHLKTCKHEQPLLKNHF